MSARRRAMSRLDGAIVALATLASVATACSLDTSGKNACADQSDCLSGYQCETGLCKPSLGAPSDLVGKYDEATATDYRLTWQDNSGGETRFEIERRIGSRGYTRLGTVPAGTTSYVTRFCKNETYRFRVRAANDSGSSEFSDEHSVVAPLLTAPDPNRVPSKPTVSKKPGSGVWPEQTVLLSWNAVDFRGEDDGTGYDIVVREDLGNINPWDVFVSLGRTITSYQIESPMLSFECKVVALSTYGETESDPLVITPSDYPQP